MISIDKNFKQIIHEWSPGEIDEIIGWTFTELIIDKIDQDYRMRFVFQKEINGDQYVVNYLYKGLPENIYVIFQYFNQKVTKAVCEGKKDRSSFFVIFENGGYFKT